MTPAAAVNVIQSAIALGWGATTTIAYPNTTFTPPASPAKWLKVDFIFGNGAVTTKGVTGGRNTVTGVLQLAVYGPKPGGTVTAGDGALDLLAESARTLFNRKRLASPNQDVVFGAASGPVRLFEESWRSLVVSVPFRVFETIP